MKRVIAAVVLLACVVGIDALVGRFSLSGDAASAGDFERRVTVGLLVPLTGERANEGRSAKRGFELATEGLQSFGVVTEVEDSRCDATYAIGAANRLLEKGAEAIVGELCNDAAVAVEQALAEQGIAYVSLDAGQPTTNGRVDAYVASKEALADYFVQWHQKTYGSEPDYMAALAFDTLTAVAMEVSDGYVVQADIIEHLSVMTHYGVAGEVKFRAAERK